MTDQNATPWTAMADVIEERGWIQHDMETDDGVCVTRACQLALTDQPGEWLIVRGVMRHRGRAEDWNDSEETTREDVLDWLRTADPITEEELAQVYGPQWREVCAVVRRAATLTAAEAQAVHRKLSVVPGDAWYAAWTAWFASEHAARDGARGGAWFASEHAARDGARGACRVCVWDVATSAAWTAVAVAVRDLISTEHYRALARPWVETIGPVHPADPPVEDWTR